jgi:hypothetical protein
MLVLEAVTVALAALSAYFAYRTVRLSVSAQDEHKRERTRLHIERIRSAVEAVSLLPHPADPTMSEDADKRLSWAIIGLSMDLPQCFEITQMHGRNMFAVLQGQPLPVSDDDIKRQCIEAAHEIELKLTLLSTNLGGHPDADKWLTRTGRVEQWKQRRKVRKRGKTEAS